MLPRDAWKADRVAVHLDSDPPKDYSLKAANLTVLEKPRCVLCLELTPVPISSGCGCSGSAGMAHIACRVRAAESDAKSRGTSSGLMVCNVCGREFTGKMFAGLSEVSESLQVSRAFVCGGLQSEVDLL